MVAPRRTRGTGETPEDVAREVEKISRDDLENGGDNKRIHAQDMINSFVERIERMNEEISALTEDRTEIYSEAKAHGFDTKILRQVIQLRKMDAADRREQRALLDLYMEAVGMASKRQTAQSLAEGE